MVDPDLVEWNYGIYEGMTSAQIHDQNPGWMVFRDGCPGGETPEEVGARVDRVIARALAAGGDVALFAHGHVLRTLVARWIELPPEEGQRFRLDTGHAVHSRFLPGCQGGERLECTTILAVRLPYSNPHWVGDPMRACRLGKSLADVESRQVHKRHWTMAGANVRLSTDAHIV